MKRFLVYSIALFCGFLSPSLEEDCSQAIIRLNKKAMENMTAAVIATSDMPEQLTELLNQPMVPGFLGQMVPSSPSRTDCKIEKFPHVNITKNADDEMAANVNVTFTTTISNVEGVGTVTVDISKNFTAILGIGRDGFTFKHCSSPAGEADIKISDPPNLTKVMTETVINMVKEKVMPVIDQNMCELAKKALEGPMGDMLNQVFVPPDGTTFSFHNMEMKGEHILFLLIMSRNKGAEEKNGQCAAPTTTSWEPPCPMKEDALADITFDATMIEKHLMQMQSKSFLLDPNKPTGETLVPRHIVVTQTSDGTVMHYEPWFTSCSPEDSTSCRHYSPGNCSLHLGITVQDSNLEMISTSESCEESTDSDEQASDGQDWSCHKASCALIASMDPVKIPIPSNMGAATEITTDYCKNQIIMTVSLQGFSK